MEKALQDIMTLSMVEFTKREVKKVAKNRYKITFYIYFTKVSVDVIFNETAEYFFIPVEGKMEIFSPTSLYKELCKKLAKQLSDKTNKNNKEVI